MKTHRIYLISSLFLLLNIDTFSQTLTDTIDIKNSVRYNFKSIAKYCDKHFFKNKNYQRTVLDTNSRYKTVYYSVQDTEYYFRFFDKNNMIRLEGYAYQYEGLYGQVKSYDKIGRLKVVSQHSFLINDIKGKLVCDCFMRYAPVEQYKNGQLIKHNRYYAMATDSFLVIIKVVTNYDRQGKKISEKTFVTKRWFYFEYKLAHYHRLKFIYFDSNEKQKKVRLFRKNNKYHI